MITASAIIPSHQNHHSEHVSPAGERPSRAHHEPTVARTLITPTMAMRWLETTNLMNRPVCDKHVRRMARDMQAGNWTTTHEAIAFDVNGVLIDGQHRLWAITIADMPVEMYVWHGMPSESFGTVDLGMSRRLDDVLRLKGGNGRVSSMEIAILRAMVGGMAGPAGLTAAEAAAAMGKHRNAIKFAVEVMPRAKHVTNAMTRAVIARAYYAVEHEKLREFGNMLSAGIVTDPDAAGIILLRQYLVDYPGGSRRDRQIRYAKTSRALYAFLRGESISRLYAATSELFLLPEEVEAS